jgi:signal transduction histidine kinase
MIVTQVDGVTLIRMPQYLENDPAMPSPDPSTGEIPPYEPTIEPTHATPVDVDPGVLAALLARPPTALSAIRAEDIDATEPTYEVMLYDDGLDRIRMALPSVAIGIALLILVAWWLASGRAGDGLRALGAPLAVATGTPFLMQPLEASWSIPLLVASSLIVTAAMVPLALGLIDRIGDAGDRRLATLLTGACALGAAVVGVLAATVPPWYGEGLTRWALVAAIPLLPGLAAAGPIDRRAGDGGPPAPASRRLLESTEYAVIGATPGVALASQGVSFPMPLILWFGVILLAGRFTIRPLARIATRATLQRDLIVAATEAERARVAADIHDDALQELTLLVHRLDAAGDAEGADMARTVSDRLRAICGDLRLPILDDLGVGPALDWLVMRIERLAGGEVRLERADGTRPPPEVELAFFRVAQEALSNAVKHGQPPILVRYATTPTGASLSIDDAGPGIDPDAGDGASRDGHFGLLNMQQRAEAIGAILDVRRWPGGGTHVALDWRAG